VSQGHFFLPRPCPFDRSGTPTAVLSGLLNLPSQYYKKVLMGAESWLLLKQDKERRKKEKIQA